MELPDYQTKNIVLDDFKTSDESKTTTTPRKDSHEPSFASCTGSIGSESIIIQQVPTFKPLNAASFPKSNSNFALFQAVSSNCPSQCKDLLDPPHKLAQHQLQQPPVNVNHKAPDGLAPLHIAAASGFLKICEVLLDYGEGADINIRNPSLQTPLHLACLHGHLPVAQLLVRSGAQLNPLDSDYNSPFLVAARQGNPEFVTWFLGKDPDLSVQNKFDQTAWELSSSPIRQLIRDYCSRRNLPLPTAESRQWGEPRQVRIADVRPLDFEVIKELGKGSFGEVYLVKKRDSQHLYAMKVLGKDKVMRQNLIKYAMTERNVLSYIRHPFIVSLNFAFQTRDKLFLILDYCSGRDLASHLLIEKRFDEGRARNYLCEILLAIEELHRRDIIFRDLKPDNVVLDSEGHAMLTDFGLSKEGVFDNSQTRSFCGSLAYLAPEMIRRKGHGKPVDWYLLGVLFYEMIVGMPPYFSPNKEELFNNIQRGKLKVPTGLSVAAKDLLKGLLRRDPSLRLGAKRDAEEVKEHSFFAGISWNSVLRRELNVPIPRQDPVHYQRIPIERVFGDLTHSSHNKVSGWTFVSD